MTRAGAKRTLTVLWEYSRRVVEKDERDIRRWHTVWAGVAAGTGAGVVGVAVWRPEILLPVCILSAISVGIGVWVGYLWWEEPKIYRARYYRACCARIQDVRNHAADRRAQGRSWESLVAAVWVVRAWCWHQRAYPVDRRLLKDAKKEALCTTITPSSSG